MRASIMLASKKDGTSRFCVDFRPLNAVTVSTPPPQISVEAAVASLGRARVFSTLDLKSGYWQVPIRCGDRKKTAFTVPDGRRIQFRAMPFGLKCAPATFQSMMTRVLEGYIGRFTLAYLDDVIVYSESWEDHCRHLALVMERLATNHLTANPAKCHLGTTEVEFLGHVVNAEGNWPQIGHLRQIAMAEVPRTRKQLQRFVGLINWLRSYIPNFSQTIVPLTDLLSPQIHYRWGEPAQAAFNAIQEAFTQCHTLARIDPDRPLVLQTDTSALGTGAVLYQVDGAGDRQVVNYASAKFGHAERRYHKNQLPDLLSRDPDGGQEVLDDDEWDDILPPACASSTGTAGHVCAHITVNGEGAEAPPNTEADVERHVLTTQHRSPDADRRRERASDDGHPTWRIQDGRVMNRPPGVTGAWRTYVPPEARETVLVFYHNHDLAGHPGTDQTSRAVGQYYHWPRMSRDVRNYVRECETCQRRKAHRGDGVQQQQPWLPTTPFQTIALDVMGPYPCSPRGKRFLVVATDMFTRWTEAYPCGNVRATTIIEVMTREFMARFGYPESILTDYGSQFLGARWKDWCQEAHMEHHTTPAYHPQSNPTERRNQELKVQLRLRLGDDHTQWDLHVADALFCVRRRVNAASGRTPAEMVQGRNLPLPGELAVHGVPHQAECRGDSDQRCSDDHEAVRTRQAHYTQVITPRTTRPPASFQPVTKCMHEFTPCRRPRVTIAPYSRHSPGDPPPDEPEHNDIAGSPATEPDVLSPEVTPGAAASN
ncbi:uncharacterized protein LOC134537785 [Bacillus rossius redtenbacheri]|uniref:uncharacterized protein LOC134537785 n=1 Tax=Bacillus rossius redtenbacheri TaxID=93214 RepID=UPI002FDEF3E6